MNIFEPPQAATGAASTPSYALARPTAANHYIGPAAALAGNAAGFSVAAMAETHDIGVAEEVWFSNLAKFAGNGGWSLGKAGDRFRFAISQADGSEVSNFTDADFFTDMRYKLFGRPWMLTMVFNGGTGVATLYVNGEIARTLTPAAGYGVSDPSNVPFIGRCDNAGAPLAAVSSSIYGCGYVESALTEAQVIEHYIASKYADAFVDGGAAWDNLYSFEDEATAPTTLSDLAGAVDFTRVGAPSTVALPRDY